MGKVKVYTAKQVGLKLGLPHVEVIRRIRRGDIEGEKMGWFWIIRENALEAAQNSDWYKKRLKSRTVG